MELGGAQRVAAGTLAKRTGRACQCPLLAAISALQLVAALHAGARS